MGRHKVYTEKHFNFTTNRDKKGVTKVIMYRNEWDPKKKQSVTAEKHYVGTLNMDTGKVAISESFLSKFPEYLGKVYFFEDRKLVARSEEEVEEILKQNPESCLDEIISPLGGWVCWQTAEDCGILKDLTDVFGPEIGRALLSLAICVYLSSNGALQIYEEWLPQNWLPKAKLLDSRETSRVLSTVTEEATKVYFQKRFDRVQKFYKEQIDNKEKTNEYRQFLALDSTAISSYSETIEDAAYGHAKQRPDLKQINYTLAVDYLTGQTCYALECEGSITDKALYPNIIAYMTASGFNLENTIFVTDRGYNSLFNIQQLIDLNLKYLTGIPLNEEAVKQKLLKYKESFGSSAFYESQVGVYCRTFEEKWLQKLPTCGSPIETTQFLHVYVNPDLQLAQIKELQNKVQQVLEKKGNGEKVDPVLLAQVKSFLIEKKDESGKTVWFKNVDKLDKAKCTKGAWAIRTNCIESPVEALLISRRRNIVETAFRSFKVENDGNMLGCTQSSFQGKLFVMSLAQSLRNIHLTNVRNFSDPPAQIAEYCASQLKANKVELTASQRKEIKLPGDSLIMAFTRLSRYKALRAKAGSAWVLQKPLSKQDRDLISLLGCPQPPRFFNP